MRVSLAASRFSALVLLSTCIAVTPQLQDDPAPMPWTPLNGSFTEISLQRPCERIDPISFSLALGSIGPEPLFAVGTDQQRVCPQAIATVRDGKVAVVVPIGGLPFGARVVGAPDGSFWTTTDSQYVNLRVRAIPKYLKPLNPGYQPIAVGVVASGTVYGLERIRGSIADEPLRLVDLSDTVSYSLPNGYVESLVLGNDGHLYFKYDTLRACTIYEVVPHRAPVARTQCIQSANQQMAIDSSGAIWQPNFLGVRRTPRVGQSEEFGPIEAIPTDIYCAPCYDPKDIVIQRDSSVWFLYSNRLWRLGVDRKLSNVVLPTASPVTGMIGTTDGNLWITAGGSALEKPESFLRFVPTTQRGPSE